MHNTRGSIQIAMIVVAAMALVVGIGMAIAKTGGMPGYNRLDSDIPFQDGDGSCDPQPIGLAITGKIDVTDESNPLLVTPDPQVTRIGVNQVKNTNTGETLAFWDRFYETDYDWKVELMQDGEVVASDSGTGTQKQKNTEHEQYYLPFTVPDNNCDGEVDNFRGTIRAKVQNDRGEESVQNRSFRVVDGEFTIG